MKKEIYFDNSATTRPYKEVIEDFNKINTLYYGNPSSLHQKGFEAEKIIDLSREKISKLLNAKTSELIFTAGGTESNNLALIGYAKANSRKKLKIISIKIEHPSVIESLKYLEKEGHQIDYIGVDSCGKIVINEFKDKLNEETDLVSISLVNSEIGNIQPIEEIGLLIKKNSSKTILHVDAVQAFGKLKIDVKKLNIDMLSISAHKIHGPKGIGALYIRTGIKLEPLFLGGGHEGGLRSGTSNVSGISGFGIASQKIYNELETNILKINNLKSYAIEQLLKNFDKVKINSCEQSVANILSVSFIGIKAEVLLHSLEQYEIFVSTKSACSSKKSSKSHVLKELNIGDEYINGTIRLSFSFDNFTEEVDFFIEKLCEIIPKIQIKARKR